MFKKYGEFILCTVVIMQFSEFIVASEHEELDEVYEIDLSIDCTQTVHNLNKKELEENLSCESITIFCDRREDRMLEKQREKNKLLKEQRWIEEKSRLQEEQQKERLSIILPVLCKNKVRSFSESASTSNNSITSQTSEEIAQRRSRFAHVDDINQLPLKQYQRLGAANIFDESFESLLNTAQKVQAYEPVDQVTQKRLACFEPLNSEPFSSASAEVSSYNGTKLDDFLLSAESVSLSSFFDRQSYQLPITPSTASGNKSDGETSA